MLFFQLICAIFILCAYLFWRRVAKRLNEPPVYPGAWPVIGHALTIGSGEGFWSLIREAAVRVPRREEASILLIGPVKLYAVCNPKDALTVANRCLDKSKYYNHLGERWMGDSLAISRSSIWKKDRKMLMPVFSHQVFEGFLDTFNRETRGILEKLSPMADKGSFDHKPYVNEFAIDAFCSTVLKVDISKKQEYVHATETLRDIIIKRFTNVFLHSNTIYAWTGLYKTENKCLEFVHTLVDEIIERKKCELARNSQNSLGYKKDFLEILLDTSAETMSTKQLRDQLNMIILAGSDAMSMTITVTLVMIGSFQDVQEKIYNESNEVLQGSCRDVELSDLDRLTYLDAVIKESMRLYPVGPFVVRELKENIKLEKYTLYRGNSCALFLYGLNMHPMWGPDAQEFRPERWLDPATLPQHPAAFASFSIGRRNCIGKYYAMMAMKTFLLHIIRNYIITADYRNIKFTMDIMLGIKSGHNISLQRRTSFS